MDDVEIKVLPVAPFGANCCIVKCKNTDEGVVIDPGGEGERIISSIEEINCQIKWILHTHAHVDHITATSDVANFCRNDKKWDVKIALHSNEITMYNNLPGQCMMFGLPPVGKPVPIDHMIIDNEEIKFGNVLIEVMYTPGHSPGSCSFYIKKESVVFSGDTLFAMGIGRTDLPGGSFDTIIESIKNRLLTLDDETQVIPGHGLMTSIYDEKRMNPFFNS